MCLQKHAVMGQMIFISSLPTIGKKKSSWYPSLYQAVVTVATQLAIPHQWKSMNQPLNQTAGKELSFTQIEVPI